MQNLESGKKRITANFIEKTLGGRDHLTYRQITHTNLPQFIKEHFYISARKRIKKEKPLEINFDAGIDYDDREIKEAMEALMLALLNNVLFSKEEAKANITFAINRRIDLLIDPAKTLENIFFQEEDKEYDNTLFCRSLQRLDHGSPFIEKVLTKVKDHQKPVYCNSFKKHIEAAERELYTQQEQNALVSEFDLLLSLFKTDEMTYRRGLSGEIVQTMLMARGLKQALKVVKKKELQGKKAWRTEDIVDIFSFVLNPRLEKRPLVRDDDTDEIISLPRVIYSDDDKSIKIKRKKIEKQPPGPYPSVYTLIEKKDYKTLVKKLFKKDEEAFIHFMDKVDQEDQWRKAKQIIDGELEKRNLDKFSREALKLGNIVFSKYFNYTY
ncbi:hypothetical protein GF407_12750 [candidate division KSB1 bacterium]|nr:hypothetical protein [candidate division KSB1 bacterium]